MLKGSIEQTDDNGVYSVKHRERIGEDDLPNVLMHRTQVTVPVALMLNLSNSCNFEQPTGLFGTT
jgi:hypothetical protein